MLSALPIPGMDEVHPGDSLVDGILAALAGNRMEIAAGDILVVTHKIVSKAEGRIVALESVHPSIQARRWATAHNLDARVTQLALDESVRVVRKARGVLITETHHGFVCANSGVDVSNVDGGASAVLLPLDPDRSARHLSRELQSRIGFPLPVIITDTFGRPWREGQIEFAIGMAGMKAFRDFRRCRDTHGYKLRVSLEAVADEIACMAGLACGKLRRIPVCIVRGFQYQPGGGRARDILRSPERDLFR
jgi:coenzyme F420-0:L-glutamate ligase/coenzyme F420-1:gamma-L-glutamate ligase